MENFNIDILEPSLSFALDESSNEVDGKHILAKIKGEFFVPDGYSRNKRFYPKELWENVLKSKDVKTELKNRTMFGAISHNTPINDESFRDGKFSHIVTKMYIDENGKGIGEALILNTPSGQILNTIARAGSKLFVSTRADGSFKGETNEGVPIVNKDTYKYHTTDFVLRPGFLDANPELVEAFNNLNNENIQENETMEKVLKALTEENGELKVDMASLNKAHEELKTSNADVLSENVVLKEENDKIATLEENATKLTTELDEAKKELELYTAIDTSENISKALDALESVLDSYKEFGTVEEIKSVVESSEVLIEKVTTFGGIEAIDKSITIAETLLKEKEELKIKTEISELAKELKVSEEKINKVYTKLSIEEIKDLFSDVEEKEMDKEDKEDKEDDKEMDKEDKEKEETKEEFLDSKDEDAEIKEEEKNTSRCGKLMEGFAKGF